MINFTKSGLAQHYRVTMDDGSTLDIRTKPSDVAMWELRNAPQVFTDGLGTSRILWVVWRAGRRSGLIEDRKFEDWLEKLDDFEVGEEEVDALDADPTQSDQSDEL